MRELGAVWLDDHRCRFRVWAPLSENVSLHLVAPDDRVVPMESQKLGYYKTVVESLPSNARYFYRLSDGREYPDPVSRYQPEGVHGPSQAVDSRFEWNDFHWAGIPIEKYVIYELHVGTFTANGTFEAAIPHLRELESLGITAVELMPVAQFPGDRNWGYDGVFPFAVHNSYGGPTGFKAFVNACHRLGIAVILDVVYNHLGPEGNYLAHFGHYFTHRYKTPWGPAVNFDDTHSDEVRRFFVSNALEWITDYHIDALRLDAVHSIIDHSALNFLEELGEAVHEQGTTLSRRVYVIAESALNDTRIIRPVELGGFGLDAQWNDDFHHSLHTLVTKEREGYYADFGNFQHMAQAFSEGFVYSGHYSVNRGRRHGNSSRNVPPMRFVVYAQNHDQVGNRMKGERLKQLVSFEAYKLSSSTVILSPFIPMLFMGDEYGETAPFQYFISHSDPDLIAAVRRGRKEEFAAFRWQGEPPDAQDEKTFWHSKLDHRLKDNPSHRTLLAFHKELIGLRKNLPALRRLSKDKMDVVSVEEQRILVVRRWHGDSEVLVIFNFADQAVERFRNIPFGAWRKRFDSSDKHWMGPGAVAKDVIETPHGELRLQPHGVLLYEKQIEE